MKPSADKRLLTSPLVDAEALYENAPCGFLSFLPDGMIIKINETLLNWLQYQREEVLDKLRFSDIISKGGNLHFEMFFRPMINMHGGVRELRYELLKKDGSSLTVLVSATTFKDPSGKINVINAAAYDITDRKKYEYELLLAKNSADAERKQFKFLADLIPEMIWTATPSGEIDYVNERFYNYFHSSSRVLSRRAILKNVWSEDRAKLVEAWKSSLQNSSELKCEVRLLNANGDPVWHILRAVPYLNEFAGVEKWFGSCANIDEHVKKLQQKDDFINVASHELKTPLTSLKAVLQMLSRVKNVPSTQLLPKLIDQANRSMDKVGNLIDDLLNVSRITAGHVSLKKTEFTVEELVNACCATMFIDQKHELIIEGDQQTRLCADIQRIEQVLVNFINNAIKYAPDSRVIRLLIEKRLSDVKISVCDSGQGIDPDKIPHLFERYYRADNTGIQYSGLGLGLYICSNIIKRHNGKIGAESELGHGSTFWFALPAVTIA